MANVLAPNGFTVVRRLDGAAWTGNMTQYLIKSGNTNSIFAGDPVARTTLSSASGGYIDQCQPALLQTQGPLGIFVGVRNANTSTIASPWAAAYLGSSTADTVCYVIDDPFVVMRCWVGTGSSATAGGPAAQADIGLNFNYSYGTGGNTTSGVSSAYLNYVTKASTNTLPFTLLGLVSQPPGINGYDTTTAGNIVEVTWNQQAFRVGNTGV